MAKITLEIEDKNFDTVLTILESIKSELITKIELDKEHSSKKPYKYVPKNNIKKKTASNTPIKAQSLKDEFKS